MNKIISCGLIEIYKYFSIRKNHSLANFVAELKRRDLLYDSYPSNIYDSYVKDLSSLPPVTYAGFDPSSDSLHIGNLLIVVNLLRSSQFGIQPIAVVGRATAAVGDPSGRVSERDEITKEALEINTSSIAHQLRKISRNVLVDGKQELIILDNSDWFEKMSVIDYLRSCRPIRVGKMMRMGAIKDRISDGISFAEFSYQTMQAYDWMILAQRYDCRFQIGGSDQLGHLDLGAHYIKRTCNGKFAAGVCLPLVTDNSGNKLGKSVGGGGVWLSAERTSPFHFYQFFKQLRDSEAEVMLQQFSLRHFEDILLTLSEHRANLGKWIAQDALAKELTQTVHGRKGLENAMRCSRALFEESTDDIRSLRREELLTLFGNSIDITKSEIRNMGELADKTRLDGIKGSSLMKKGAFKINGIKITDPTVRVDFSMVTLPEASDLTVICWGKRNFHLVRWV